MGDQCLDQLRGEQLRRPRLLQAEGEVGLEVLGGQGPQGQARPDSAPQREQLRGPEALGQAAVPAEKGDEEALGVEAGAGEQPQLGEAFAGELLGLVDQEDRTEERRLAVGPPAGPERLEAAIAIRGREGGTPKSTPSSR